MYLAPLVDGSGAYLMGRESAKRESEREAATLSPAALDDLLSPRRKAELLAAAQQAVADAW